MHKNSDSHEMHCIGVISMVEHMSSAEVNGWKNDGFYVTDTCPMLWVVDMSYHMI